MNLITKEEYFSGEYRCNNVPVFIDRGNGVEDGYIIDDLIYKQDSHYGASDEILCHIDDVKLISGYSSFDF